MGLAEQTDPSVELANQGLLQGFSRHSAAQRAHLGACRNQPRCSSLDSGGAGTWLRDWAMPDASAGLRTRQPGATVPPGQRGALCHASLFTQRRSTIVGLLSPALFAVSVLRLHPRRACVCRSAAYVAATSFSSLFCASIDSTR
jgi:hypothetical protein